MPCVSVISRRQFSSVVGAFGEPHLQWGLGRRVVFYSDFLLVHVVKKGMCDKTPRSSIREARWREVKIAQENGDREAGKIRGSRWGAGGLGYQTYHSGGGWGGWVELCHPGLQTWPCFIYDKNYWLHFPVGTRHVDRVQPAFTTHSRLQVLKDTLF